MNANAGLAACLAIAVVACKPPRVPTHGELDPVAGPATPSLAAPSVPRAHDACTDVPNELGVRLLPGFCMRTIARGLLRPRGLAIGPHGEILVAESGPGWRHGRGRVSVLTAQPDGTYGASVFLDRLDRPHGIVFHDGAVYIAEAGRVIRARYPEETPHVDVLVDALPSTGRHIHKTLIFGPEGALYYSVGSATDNCGALDAATVGEEPCAEAQGIAREGVDAGPGPITVRAAIHRFDPRRGRSTVFARGLRNNLGLAWHASSGRLWGVDNARDYIQRIDPQLLDSELPHDELNEIVAGADYGWPYCFDGARASPEYPARARHCSQATRSPVLLPPHSAPTSIVFYDSDAFPAAFRTRAFIAYHGYRVEGHRIVSIPFDAAGAPSGPPEDFVTGWEERPGRPHGHLMGLAVARNGSLLVSDDVAGTVHMISFGESALANVASPTPAVTEVESQTAIDARCAASARLHGEFAAIERDIIDTRCANCHASGAGSLLLRRCDTVANHRALAQGSSAAYGRYVVASDATQGYLMARLRGDSMGPRMPPPGTDLTAAELAQFEAWIRAGAPGPL